MTVFLQPHSEMRRSFHVNLAQGEGIVGSNSSGFIELGRCSSGVPELTDRLMRAPAKSDCFPARQGPSVAMIDRLTMVRHSNSTTRVSTLSATDLVEFERRLVIILCRAW